MVEVINVQPGDFTVSVNTHGTLKPQTQSALVSQVSGRIVHSAAHFQEGGFFKENEVVLQIDPEEYQLAVASSEAALQGVIAKKDELLIQKANYEKSLAIETQHLDLTKQQYVRNTNLQKGGTVAKSALELSQREYLARQLALQTLKNSLALIPIQIKSLQAEIQLKQVQLSRAKLDLERTTIRTPYEGRLLKKEVDLGQSVSKGSLLATLYATDNLLVRLPITDRQRAFLDFPRVPFVDKEKSTENHTLKEDGNNGFGSDVSLIAHFGNNKRVWSGRIVRTEATIDAQTRQQFAIAQIEKAYQPVEGGYQLQVGQFVQAHIQGRTLSNVYTIPREAIRANNRVMLITMESRIKRQPVTVAWQTKNSAIISHGLKPGDRLSLTPLPYAPEGADVLVSGEEPSKKSDKNNKKKKAGEQT